MKLRSVNHKLLVLFLVAVTGSCSSPKTEWDSFGAEIQSEGAISLVNSIANLDGDENNVKIVAEIQDVCQAKGCWMTLKSENGESVRVTFKDYGFLVPKDASGKQVVISGVASITELEEDMAKHYADDAGEEFDPSESRKEVSIVASGVLIERSTQL
ncbi:MAG: DUF4920 domain-containing protein [Cyclobacteriaceae bacterium]